MSNWVQTQIDNQVGTVTLSRSELHNAFNEEMIQSLHSAFLTLGQNNDVRVIILAAEGKSFCAGADLNWMQKMVNYTFEENVADANALARMLQTIHDCPKPVIAKIHGAAFGGGVGLIAACDIAISLNSALFALTEVKLGLLPAVISPFVLEKIGVSAARRYFLTAERFDAAEAKRMGLISDTVGTLEEMDTWITQIVDALKANGPEAIAVCKTLIQTVNAHAWEASIQATTRLIAERRISAEGQEGMQSFLQKRSPHWVPAKADTHV